MILAETAGITIGDLGSLIDPTTLRGEVNSRDVTVALTNGDPSIRWGGNETPATGAGLVALGNVVDIPSKFLERLDPDLQETLINSLLHRASDDVKIESNDDTIVDVYPAKYARVPAGAVVDVATSVIGVDGPVIGWRRDNTGYGFEVTVPDMASYGQGGDPAVGDIMRGGLRFGQDLKHGLAPWVQEYTYRLVCTNGMEVEDPSLKIKIKGNTLDQILEELEAKAEEAFGRVETTIASYYDLRNQRVDRPEQTLTRIAREHGLSDKTLADLIRDLPNYMEEDGTVTMFQIVNMITNAANREERFGVARKLQVVGGAVAYDHSSRCPNCRSRID